MFLLVVNYPSEINLGIFEQKDKFDVCFINENKGFVFGMKLLKILAENKNKYDFVLHFGLCGGKTQEQIGKIYKIDRTFLFDQNIIENQRFKKGNFKFETLDNSNIVTKFKISKNSDLIYDFADIYDLETFWVANVSNYISIPVFSIKGVSDINDFLFDDIQNEVDILLNPDNKRKKKDFYMDKLSQNIDIVNSNLKDFFDNELLDFYDRYINEKDFRKSFYV